MTGYSNINLFIWCIISYLSWCTTVTYWIWIISWSARGISPCTDIKQCPTTWLHCGLWVSVFWRLFESLYPSNYIHVNPYKYETKCSCICTPFFFFWKTHRINLDKPTMKKNDKNEPLADIKYCTLFLKMIVLAVSLP